VADFCSIEQEIWSEVNDVSLDINDIEKCIEKLKLNKSSGHDGLTAEHVVNSHPALVVHFKLLFWIMLKFSFIPDDLGVGTIVPIVKDYRGDLSSVDNYRPITISPVISKLFEILLIEKYACFLESDDLQFGFKKGHSCSHALFLLRQTIDYFTKQGSDVFLVSLDASKAFDRVNHVKLYTILNNSKVPKVFIRTIINWYSKLSANVKWNDCFSDIFYICSGVRQGGILSPLLFNVYVNIMITRLRSSDFGCKLHHYYVGCIMYADDLILISASIINLQCMLDICTFTSHELGIKFNGLKSNCIHIGPSRIKFKPVLLVDNQIISWSDKIKYLGVWIKSNFQFELDPSESRRKFFISVNTVLSKCSFACDMVKLKLMESYCLPILLYGSESGCVDESLLLLFNSCWNSVYRKIFGYFKWESVRNVMACLNKLNVIHLVNLRRILFIKRMHLSNHVNETLAGIIKVYINNNEFQTILSNFRIDFSASAGFINDNFHSHFLNTCH